MTNNTGVLFCRTVAVTAMCMRHKFVDSNPEGDYSPKNAEHSNRPQRLRQAFLPNRTMDPDDGRAMHSTRHSSRHSTILSTMHSRMQSIIPPSISAITMRWMRLFCRFTAPQPVLDSLFFALAKRPPLLCPGQQSAIRQRHPQQTSQRGKY